ncbi:MULTISPECIES: molybdopterin-dependent oxidoreductase [unclassified Massilia]|uniref:molybdopterin-dependent oxidoreductase n=1 Tax=unclassified Massilia TaxID=2609279 RepID=UPI0017866426|nr:MULTISPECIES: molybdopterin-dependent oxidoreductase [unclassified Massilia]MBD8531405.1 molybdopterin-dependent oxidoreductase [Massilia sp. CFBP 13647]MBD8674341.1 molybdopterin-dependent oxidoreductase [Massilia sp. CFBP 13721]
MNKRDFLGAALAAGALPAATASAAKEPACTTAAGPALLTISGAIRRPNRGALDGALDQMMAKHKLAFTQARALDFAALARLPARSIRPTLEYDGKPHGLRGPLLFEVLALAGAPTRPDTRITLRAVDGYAATITLRQARAQGFIVATHLDGQPMALGGLGPLWAIYDADRVPEMAAQPLAARFGSCPWALYHIDVQARPGA